MCGIYFAVSRSKAREPGPETVSSLKCRGPDAFRSVTVSVPGVHPANGYTLTFCASVLALRGEHVQEQPLVDPGTGSVLCWNGEAWKTHGRKVTGNDSLVIFKYLLSAAAQADSSTRITGALTGIAGPYSFVFYDALSSTVYYGRDRLGRRSLILQQQDPDHLVFCSVSTPTLASPEEVSTNHLHCITLSNGILHIQQLSWPTTLPTINNDLPDGPIDETPLPETTKLLLENLAESLRLRILDIPNPYKLHKRPESAKVAILFSGGLDCTLLGRVAHDLLPLAQSVDLLNVAFENPRSMRTRPIGRSPYEVCPDRITGRTSFAELVKVCPGRCWRFVAIDISYHEAMTHKPIILQLMRPHNTEMDLSIAMALYFAARGQGYVSTSPAHSEMPEGYTTPARVLLSGLGADELFGGYSRHAAAFERAGFPSLMEELSLDFSRIGQRNLGRDDRVISHWGKEVRYPYLDEDFVQFALALPVWERCGFRLGKQTPKHYEDVAKAEKDADLDPSKMLLRMLLWKLGMRSAAAERKRAIQFGAKTAKMEISSGKRKGTELLEAG